VYGLGLGYGFVAGYHPYRWGYPYYRFHGRPPNLLLSGRSGAVAIQGRGYTRVTRTDRTPGGLLSGGSNGGGSGTSSTPTAPAAPATVSPSGHTSGGAPSSRRAQPR
jgi:hypothetical protein